MTWHPQSTNALSKPPSPPRPAPDITRKCCIALSRLIGKEALTHVIESYKKGFISITQALAAIVEIPGDQIMSLRKDSLPIELAQYLDFN
jgi:hypothetical protein